MKEDEIIDNSMPEKSLTKKTINGVVWTMIQKFGALLISLVANVFLARLLSPTDFGCIGILLAFTTIADVLIDGGLGAALIQKKRLNDDDCSTVFVTNFIISVLIFILLFVLSPAISTYFRIPILKDVLRVESVAIILRSLYIVQSSLLNRKLQFKKISIIIISSNFISVVVAVIAAYRGMGVWSLVIKNLSLHLFLCFLYWIYGSWKISVKFNSKNFIGLFRFGGLITLSNLIEMFFSNIQSVIIGRKFLASELGYYSQAKSLGQIPIYSVSMMLNQVLFPTLSKLQDNKNAMMAGTQKSLLAITYLAFPLITLVCVLAKPLVILLYTEKWILSVPMLQLICIAGLINSVIHTNYSVLKSSGRTDLYLYIQLIINSIILILMLSLVKYGVVGMLIGHVVGSYLGCVILMFFSGKAIGYGFMKQLKDIIPAFLVSILLGILLYFINFNINNSPITIIIVSSLLYFIIYFIISYIAKLKGFIIYRKIFSEMLNNRNC